MRKKPHFVNFEPGGQKACAYHLVNLTDKNKVSKSVLATGEQKGSSFDFEKVNDQYELKKLLASGVPLHEVSCMLTPQTTDGLLSQSDIISSKLMNKIVDHETSLLDVPVESAPIPSENE